MYLIKIIFIPQVNGAIGAAQLSIQKSIGLMEQKT